MADQRARKLGEHRRLRRGRRARLDRVISVVQSDGDNFARVGDGRKENNLVEPASPLSDQVPGFVCRPPDGGPIAICGVKQVAQRGRKLGADIARAQKAFPFHHPQQLVAVVEIRSKFHLPLR